MHDAFSLLEVLAAIGLALSFSVALITMAIGSRFFLDVNSAGVEASALAVEGIEAVRAISKDAWNALRYGQTGISLDASGAWQLSGEGTSDVIGRYQRTLAIRDRCRAADGVRAPCPSVSIDAESKEVTATVTWITSRGSVQSVQHTSVLTNWAAIFWAQRSWAGGAGEATWRDASKYDRDDGNIEVDPTGAVALARPSARGWLISSAYDTGVSSSFGTITWEAVVPEECGAACSVRLQVQTAPDAGGMPGGWPSTWSGPDGEDGDEDDAFTTMTGSVIHLDHNGDRWVRYRAALAGDGIRTPLLRAVFIRYR